MTATTYHTRSDVKDSLTPVRRGRVIENDQYAAFARRVIRAYSRRVSAGDIEAISDMTDLAADLDQAISRLRGNRLIGQRGGQVDFDELATVAEGGDAEQSARGSECRADR